MIRTLLLHIKEQIRITMMTYNSAVPSLQNETAL